MTAKGRPQPTRDSKSSLYEAALAAVQDRAEVARAKAAARPRLARRFPWLVSVGAVGVAGLVLLLARPTWLVGPLGPPPETPGVSAASLRLSLLHNRELVRHHLRRTGSAPLSLAEAGSTTPGIEYRRTDDGFVLSGRAGDSLIVLRSGDSTAAFLGNSLSRLKGRGLQR